MRRSEEKKKKNQRKGMVGVSPFIVVSSANSFRICGWLIAHTHARTHTLLLALHGNHHGNKMYRT